MAEVSTPAGASATKSLTARFTPSPKVLFAMAGFWVLLFFEPVNLGPVTVSQVWKGSAILTMLLLVFRQHMPVWFLFALLFSLKGLVYVTSPNGIFTALAESLEHLIFPVLLFYLILTNRERPDAVMRMHNLSIYIALFFIFSAVPFMFGLQSLQPERDLSMWGLERDATTGLFYSLAPAAQTYLTATLVILASYKRFSHGLLRRALFLLTVALGTYLVYFSFTRTGWIIYAGGLLIFIGSLNSTKHKIVAIFLGAAMALAAYLYLVQNDAFMLRLAGGATYRRDVEVGLEALLNSRFPLIITALQNLNSFGAPGWILGYGTEMQKSLFEAKTGMAIVSHNGIMDTIGRSGLIGMALYLSFIFSLWLRLQRGMRMNPNLKPLIVICAYCWTATFIISHGLPVQAQVVIAGVAAAALLERRYRPGSRRSQAYY